MLRDYIRILLEASAAKKRGIDPKKLENEKISKYTGPNYFVSYTAINKIGINPRSEYHTPIGVYCYSVADLGERALRGYVPFADEQPHIQVLYSDLKGAVDVDSRGRTENDRHWDELAREIFSDVAREQVKGDVQVLNDNFQPKLERLEDLIRRHNTIQHPGIAASIENVKKLLISLQNRELEPGRVAFLLVEGMEQIDIIDQPEIEDDFEYTMYDRALSFLKELYDKAYEYTTQFGYIRVDRVVDELISRTKYHTGFGLFWNATRLLANNPKRWTKILIAHGVRAVVDHGAGLIHPNEPAQAVFLDPRAYQHVDTLENPKLKKKINVKDHVFSDGKTGKIHTEYEVSGETTRVYKSMYDEYGDLHSDRDKPSYVMYEISGGTKKLITQQWHKNANRHRETGPASIVEGESRWYTKDDLYGIYNPGVNAAIFREGPDQDGVYRFLSAKEKYGLNPEIFQKSVNLDKVLDSKPSEEMIHTLVKSMYAHYTFKRADVIYKKHKDSISKDMLSLLETGHEEELFRRPLSEEEMEFIRPYITKQEATLPDVAKWIFMGIYRSVKDEVRSRQISASWAS